MRRRAECHSKKPPAHPININSASAGQLQQVPGIGPATADKILQMRKSYGAFKSVDDLLAIRGIGPKRLDKMRKYLVAGRQSAQCRKGQREFRGAREMFWMRARIAGKEIRGCRESTAVKKMLPNQPKLQTHR